MLGFTEHRKGNISQGRGEAGYKSRPLACRREGASPQGRGHGPLGALCAGGKERVSKVGVMAPSVLCVQEGKSESPRSGVMAPSVLCVQEGGRESPRSGPWAPRRVGALKCTWVEGATMGVGRDEPRAGYEVI
jgi:hypothetical protein